ncbi:hypothetical protein BCR43DRAFT_186541 [Syncephalastrum racemosum]|uniref:RNA polymerase II elongation factor ELL N-terminal domain-containing protein n=1 Tax=Syncephalastrum racemosum TaxID=13706 RepID=A0A1X2HQG6_SYNRA|nr:hypothetical protein BCR43DRAFT_186541 [Syncephalastrum racemosum]
MPLLTSHSEQTIVIGNRTFPCTSNIDHKPSGKVKVYERVPLSQSHSPNSRSVALKWVPPLAAESTPKRVLTAEDRARYRALTEQCEREKKARKIELLDISEMPPPPPKRQRRTKTSSTASSRYQKQSSASSTTTVAADHPPAQPTRTLKDIPDGLFRRFFALLALYSLSTYEVAKRLHASLVDAEILCKEYAVCGDDGAWELKPSAYARVDIHGWDYSWHDREFVMRRAEGAYDKAGYDLDAPERDNLFVNPELNHKPLPLRGKNGKPFFRPKMSEKRMAEAAARLKEESNNHPSPGSEQQQQQQPSAAKRRSPSESDRGDDSPSTKRNRHTSDGLHPPSGSPVRSAQTTPHRRPTKAGDSPLQQRPSKAPNAERLKTQRPKSESPAVTPDRKGSAKSSIKDLAKLQRSKTDNLSVKEQKAERALTKSPSLMPAKDTPRKVKSETKEPSKLHRTESSISSKEPPRASRPAGKKPASLHRKKADTTSIKPRRADSDTTTSSSASSPHTISEDRSYKDDARSYQRVKTDKKDGKIQTKSDTRPVKVDTLSPAKAKLPSKQTTQKVSSPHRPSSRDDSPRQKHSIPNDIKAHAGGKADITTAKNDTQIFTTLSQTPFIRPVIETQEQFTKFCHEHEQKKVVYRKAKSYLQEKHKLFVAALSEASFDPRASNDEQKRQLYDDAKRIYMAKGGKGPAFKSALRLLRECEKTRDELDGTFQALAKARQAKHFESPSDYASGTDEE